ncbi:hypothetical protein [Salimicrobium salexigens]|uniref:PilZ domain-containing protein n=1 Tax=Salimicrobium salexigens TaxID=908941 RepID=A0ABY1KL62_9BACI|nr:hypothetical protein [Salimicrobium salexigens]SIS46981.1 hypothetical protein SAMN05421758_101362 [Salimicrobium salexigens]
MEDLYSSTLGTLERTFMPYGSEYQHYIDFQTFRDMKQVAKGKRPVYIDLDIEEIAEMKTRYIVDLSWKGVYMTVTVPLSSMFQATVEMYGKPPRLLIARLERINGREEDSLVPTSLKEEFTRKKGLGETLGDFATKLFLFLDSYLEHNVTGIREEGPPDNPVSEQAAEIFEGWVFPFAESDPELQADWRSLKKRTQKQFERIDKLDIEDQHALETMILKDVPVFLDSFSSLSPENKQKKKEELKETMEDLRKFIERLEAKEEETYTKNFARSKGIITTKYKDSGQEMFSSGEEDPY